MQEFADVKNSMWVMLFDDPSECMEVAEEGFKIGREVDVNSTWAGKGFKSWADAREHLTLSDADATNRVEDMLRELHDSSMARPASRRRTRRWNEMAGDVDVDRVLRGNPEYLQVMDRDVRYGPTSVTMYCNLDAYGGDTPEKIFWRGAAAIAATDLLEDAGFATEVWSWCRGRHVFKGSQPHQLTAMRLKGINDPVDMISLISGLSSWMLRLGIFNTFAAGKPGSRGLGGPNYELGDCKRHMTADAKATHELFMPVVETKKEAIEAAKQMLLTMTERVY